MDAAPVIARGHNVAVFVPPVTEAALAVLQAGGKRPALVLTPDAARAAELADGLPGAFAVTGLTRARRVLANDPPAVVASGACDALELLTRSALHPAAFAGVVLAWPEHLDEEGEAALASVMAELDKEAQRILLTSRAGEATAALIERYAFKAMTFGFPSPEQPPEPPLGPARYVIGTPDRTAALRRAVLDALPDVAAEMVTVAPCPLSRTAAQELLAQATGREAPVIVAQPHQLVWLRSLFAPLTSLHVAGGADLAGSRALKLRARLEKTIESEDLDPELLIVGPLLERFDPATVAAAALRLSARHPAPAQEPRPGGGAPSSGVPSIAKIWVGIGRKDGAKPGDLVGAIVHEAGVSADAIGRIEVKDLFCLVDVRSDAAEQVVKGLTGKSVRGRRLVARLDRGPQAGARPPRRA